MKIDKSILESAVAEQVTASEAKNLTVEQDEALKSAMFQEQWKSLNRAERRKLMKAERSSIYTKKFKSEGARKSAIIAHNKKVDALEAQLKRGYL